MHERYHGSSRTAIHHRWYQTEPHIETTTLNKTFLGVVRDTRDPQKMGRMLVYIAELSGDPNRTENWVICSYSSPFAGASYVDTGAFRDLQNSSTPDRTSNAIVDLTDIAQRRTPENVEGEFGGRQSYGMWFTPPDIGNEVLVVFINGDPNFAVWIGCLYQQDMNYMVPGIAQDTIRGTQEDGPVIETDAASDETTSTNPARKAYTPLRDALKISQGLDRDVLRGQSTSTAKRESPSDVFGILTPDGNHFVMDDNPTNEFIRVRTKGGAQLLIHQSEGFVYVITRNGNAWIELSDEGNVDIYATQNISVHAEKGNVNVKAGTGNINMEAATDINIVAGGNIKMTAGGSFDTDVQGSISTQSQQQISLTSVADFAINSSRNIGITASGNISEQGANVFMNSGAGPQAIPPTPPPQQPATGPTTPPESSATGLWEAGEAYSSNIIPRVPQHEPWTGHKSKTTGTNRSIPESPKDPDIKTGAAEKNSLFPLSQILPDGSVLEGLGFNNLGLPEYIDVGKIAVDAIIPIETLEISTNGLELIKQFEGIENRVYNDIAGNATIGVGHLITDADKAAGKFTNGFISDEEIDEVLLEDLQSAQTAVRGCVNQSLTSDQYDALISLAFNIGNTAFCDSTLVKRINEERYEEVPNEFQRWNKVRRPDGTLRVSKGLTNRRVAEARLFAKIPTV